MTRTPPLARTLLHGERASRVLLAGASGVLLAAASGVALTDASRRPVVGAASLPGGAS